MKRILIKNARIVNEGSISEGDLLIEGEFISEIAGQISAKHPNTEIIDAESSYLIPGAIDDQVHFREPGLTHKGDIASESAAAVAGGVTSYVEQPNTVPNAVTQSDLAHKYELGAQKSLANYSFMMGATNDNLEEVLRTDASNVAGIKIFLGSSTGNMLVDDEKVLERIFESTPLLIATHCEDEQTIRENLEKYKTEFGEAITAEMHPKIRSAEACYLSSSRAVALARKTGARLHVFHLSTAKEMQLFGNDVPLSQKQITAEVCVHHLWFTEADYARKGNLIKWNPAVKTQADKDALWQALLDDRIDVIATDHAPHTLAEKSQPYLSAPSGGPLVQHSVVAMFEMFHQGRISVEKIVEKMAHNPAIVFKIQKRGFIREGYYADLVIVNPAAPWNVKKENILYKCGWSPFENDNFKSRIMFTFVNGQIAYANQRIRNVKAGQRLLFDRA